MSNNGIKKAKEQVVRMDDFVMDGLFSLSDDEFLQEAMEEGVDLAAVGDAGRAQAHRVVITHISDELDEGHAREEASRAFGGPVEVAHEGAVYTV